MPQKSFTVNILQKIIVKAFYQKTCHGISPVARLVLDLFNCNRGVVVVCALILVNDAVINDPRTVGGAGVDSYID